MAKGKEAPTRQHHEMASGSGGGADDVSNNKPSARFYADGGIVKTKNMEHVRHMRGMKGFKKTRG